MNTIIPIQITSAMIGASTTVAEPAASETAWVSGSAYAVGDLRIRATTHRVYECVQTVIAGRTTSPENDPTYWIDKAPTQLFAPFDYYKSTAATSTTSMSYVLSPGYFNAVALYGLTGDTLSVTVKDAPGGAVIYPTNTIDLSEPPAGWYEYLFSPRKVINRVILKDLPIRPTAELTLTITAGSGAAVGVGMINVGDYTSLLGDGTWGGTLSGASAEPITTSYINTDSDGTVSIVRRNSATNLRATVVVPPDQTDQALFKLQSILDVPASFIVSSKAGFAGLNVFGLASAPVSYGPGSGNIEITVRGFI